MSNLATFKSANLPSVKAMSAALKTVKVADVGSIILKMDKTGHWVFGADQTEIESDSTWAVNPLSFIHGYIAWGKQEVLGEKMVGIVEPLPELDAAPAGAAKGWEPQVGFSMRCMSGEDEGIEVRYSTTAVGGKRAVQSLGLEIATHIDEDEATPVAVLKLGKEFYTHKSYGKIYTPVFEIVKWVSMDSKPEAIAASKDEVVAKIEAAEVVEEEAPAETGRRRRTRG